MAELDFRVLGPLEVRRRGHALPLTAPKQRALLSLLLLQANQPVPQTELIHRLWPEEVPATARAALYNLVHSLRSLLGRETIERTSAGYVLTIPARALDAERFRRLSHDARALGAVERAARLRRALALWRGPPFVDVSTDPAARTAAIRLEEERLTALEDRIEADLELGEHASLVSELEQLVEEQPLRERLWSQLMLSLYRAGRQADAVTAYRRAHDAFVGALAIEPGVVLRELQRAILVQDPALDDPRHVLGSTLERAAAVLPRTPRDRAQSLYEYGDALIRVGELRHAESTLNAARRLATAAGDRGLQERVRVLLSFLAVFAEGGNLDQHRAAAEEAVRSFEKMDDAAGVAFALSHVAHVQRDGGNADLGLRLATRAAGLAAQAGDSILEGRCMRMAVVCAALGSTTVREALARYRWNGAMGGSHDPLATVVKGWLLAQAGDITEAREAYEYELARLAAQGIVLTLSVAYVYAGYAERASGDLSRAADHFRRSYELVKAGGVRGDLGAVAGELACALALLEEPEEASALAAESRAHAVTDDVVSEVLSSRAQALVAMHESRHEDARRLSEQATSRVADTDWLTFRGETLEEAALLLSRAGDADASVRALQEAHDVYRLKGNVAGVDRVGRAIEGGTVSL